MSGPDTSPLLHRLWGSRFLLVEWVRRDFSARFKQSSLGLTYIILQPLLILAIYGLVFTQVLGISTGHTPYVLFAASGLTIWTFFAAALGRCVPSLIGSQSIVTKVYFPREVIPLSAVTVSVLDLAVTFSLVFVLQVAIGSGLHPAQVLIPVVLLGLIVFTAAVATFLATLAVFVRDVAQLLPLVLQLGFIATPVMYPSGRVPARYQWIVNLNPIATAIKSLRAVMLEGTWPPAIELFGPLVAGLCLLVLALSYLRSVEHRFPDVM